MLRSLLFMPANEKFLAKVASVDADAVIVDLEDSILEQDKSAALERAVAFFQAFDGSKTCFVRLNRSRLAEEIAALAPIPTVKGFMIPKMEDPEILAPYAETLDGKKIIALVETPLGALRVEKIAASERIHMLALGAEDLTCSMNMDNSFEVLYYYRSKIILAAKAFKKPVYDTPSFVFRDLEQFKSETRPLVGMGFDGKLAIHPAQAPIVNELFGQYDADTIRDIIEKFEQSGKGVFEYNGKVYEKPHVDHLKNILKSLDKGE